ncbi:hypothetical protein, partial [Rhizobium nepotum]|uniref:hypothetical protein n=1 Tax=Rhizobium nepotum TaxID=1035271 RepID=UPI001AEBC9D5
MQTGLRQSGCCLSVSYAVSKARPGALTAGFEGLAKALPAKSRLLAGYLRKPMGMGPHMRGENGGGFHLHVPPGPTVCEIILYFQYHSKNVSFLTMG